MHVRFVWVGVRLGTSGAAMHARYMWVVVRLGTSGVTTHLRYMWVVRYIGYVKGHYARDVYGGC